MHHPATQVQPGQGAQGHGEPGSTVFVRLLKDKARKDELRTILPNDQLEFERNLWDEWIATVPRVVESQALDSVRRAGATAETYNQDSTVIKFPRAADTFNEVKWLDRAKGAVNMLVVATLVHAALLWITF